MIDSIAAPAVSSPPALDPLASLPDERAKDKPAPIPALIDAQARLAAKDFEGAARALLDHLARAAGDGAVHDTLAQALERLGRTDEAAHHFSSAARLYTREGKEQAARVASAATRRVDPLASRRETFQRKVVADLLGAAQELESQGHPLRTITLLEGIAPLADGDDAADVRALLDKARAAFEEVDLDEGTRDRPASGEWPLVESESAHYRLACHLEPEVVELIGSVMDDVHAHYVQVYFEGDAKRARSEKPTIRIHPTREKMLEGWRGASSPEGWWSPGTNEVISYDTRTNSGSLDNLLETLYHEASHQFMTLASGGGFVPAWLNEGTATFFEGTRAMADHKVIWPDAATGRLFSLVGQLDSGQPPGARDVIAYDAPGSYAPEYYSYGWGLVYFLLEYEAADTLEHVYRPIYARYKHEIIQRGGRPLELFEELVLGKASPLRHATFADFERDWRAWIKDQVHPLFGRGPDVRKRRMERIARYLAAADAAKGAKKARVGELELLERANRDIDYVRERIDGEETPDGELLASQASVLVRLKRPAAAAPLLERALELADDKRWTIDETRRAALEKELAQLDRKNAALRLARTRVAGLTTSARALLADYRARGAEGALRAYTFASELGAALGDAQGLVASAADLRLVARDLGRLSGTIHGLAAPDERWITVLAAQPDEFQVVPGRVTLEAVRPSAFVDGDVRVHDEYEVRATLVREGRREIGSAYGIVAAGPQQGDWVLIGIDERGHAGVWNVVRSSKSGASVTRAQTLRLESPVAEDELPAIAVRVRADGRVTLTVGARKPVETRLALDPTRPRHVGVFAKNCRLTVRDALVEQFP